MKEFVVSKGENDMRADRFLQKKGYAFGALQKAFRKKDIKQNGKPAKPDTRLVCGDVLRVYLPPPEEQQSKTWDNLPPPEMVYEDAHLVVMNKPAGVLSQQANGEPGMEERLRAAIKGEDGFLPSLCHRLDRGTAGLLLGAKTPEALRVLAAKIKQKEIRKFYRANVRGTPQPQQGTWEDWLWKDPARSLVFVVPKTRPGAKFASLSYKTCATDGKSSTLEIELHTGRTHQIRVQCASRGHAIIGDGKYGLSNGKTHQDLTAVRLTFDFRTDAGCLNALNGKTFWLP